MADFSLPANPQTRKPESWEIGEMKTMLDLPGELVGEMKLRAAQEGKRLKDVAPWVADFGNGDGPERGLQIPPARDSGIENPAPLKDPISNYFWSR